VVAAGDRTIAISSNHAAGKRAPSQALGPRLAVADATTRSGYHARRKTTRINSRNAPAASGGYSQALEVEGAQRLLFISGQIPEAVDGNVPDDFAAQAKLVWANVLAQLDAANMAVDNLVKVTTFLSSRQHALANSEARRQALGAHAPALTVIIAGIYDERWLLEVEAVAAA
jgi:enamine deaminase RidA (YjgF/YER057c/UK114 family)